jgi:hypothetical protein
MGGEPPQGQQHEERDERAVQARGHWLAQHLGEQWRSDGDGIYRLVASEDPPESEPLTRESTAAQTPDDVDELIAELSADLRRG